MDTIANIVDKLCIQNIKIWMAEDRKRDPEATDKQIADATRITNIANQARNDLMQELDEKINEMVATGKLQKLYGQGSTKMYGK